MTRFPDKLQVGPFTYRVIVDQAAIDAASRQRRQSLIGHCDPDALEIIIAPDLVPSVAADTLIHEVLHAACSLGVIFDDPEVEDAAVSRLAPILLDIVQRNPGLIKALARK